MLEPSLPLALGLIALGLLLLAAEMFITTAGLLLVLALVCLAGGVFVAFRLDAYTGFVALVGTFVAAPVVAMLSLQMMPRTWLGRRFVMNAPEEDATLASTPVNLELERLRGRYGRAVG